MRPCKYLYLGGKKKKALLCHQNNDANCQGSHAQHPFGCARMGPLMGPGQLALFLQRDR